LEKLGKFPKSPKSAGARLDPRLREYALGPIEGWPVGTDEALARAGGAEGRPEAGRDPSILVVRPEAACGRRETKNELCARAWKFYRALLAELAEAELRSEAERGSEAELRSEAERGSEAAAAGGGRAAHRPAGRPVARKPEKRVENREDKPERKAPLRCLVVSHGGFIHAFLNSVLRVRCDRVPNCSINRIDLELDCRRRAKGGFAADAKVLRRTLLRPPEG
jgi:broad specificity phosphatase PhoE